ALIRGIANALTGALRKYRQSALADLCKAAGNRDFLWGRAGRTIDRDLSVAERRHVGRMAGHDAGFALGPGNNDHVDVVGHHQAVGGDQLEMQIGHQSLPSSFASNTRVAASNLSRQPVLQKPTTLPL